MGGAAGEASDGVTGTTGGGTGGAGGSGGTGGTTAGGVVLEDDCSLEACGGDLANTDWRHVRACVPKDQVIGPLQDFCPSITLTSSSGELEGAISFTDADYTQGVTFSLTIELDIPADCEINCSSFGATLAVLGFPGSTCTESNEVCHCTGTAQGSDGRYGNYTTEDDTLTFLGLGDLEASYCVGEGTFDYRLPVMLVPQGTPMDVLYETVSQ